MPPTGAQGTRTLRIVIVDDHPIVRKGLVDLFNGMADLHVCGEAATVADALTTIAVTRPDVAVVDLTLGDESGLDLVAHLASSQPAVRVLVLSGHDERLYAERALKAGALGYAMKDQSADDLVAAVRRVAAGKPAVSVETTERLLATLGTSRRTSSTRSPIERLSNREHHVLVLVGRGLSTREIAGQLRVSVKTIESHCAHLKDKLGARNGRELMRLAVSFTAGAPPALSPQAAPGLAPPLRGR